jgi:hypothetical protein
LRFPYKEKEIKHVPEEIGQDECTHLLLEFGLVCTPLLQVMTFKSIVSREDEKAGTATRVNSSLTNVPMYKNVSPPIPFESVGRECIRSTRIINGKRRVRTTEENSLVLLIFNPGYKIG